MTVSATLAEDLSRHFTVFTDTATFARDGLGYIFTESSLIPADDNAAATCLNCGDILYYTSYHSLRMVLRNPVMILRYLSLPGLGREKLLSLPRRPP